MIMNFDNMKNLLDNFVETGHAPGNTISVYKDGKNVFKYSCGYSDIENRKPMIGDEMFYLWSCSKVTTVTAALQLFEKGLFLLDDPLYEYIPEYKDVTVQEENGEIVKAKNPITIRNLFNMTAGIRFGRNLESAKEASKITNDKMDTDVMIRCTAKEPLYFHPGTKWQYTPCHDVLGGLVSIITGKKFRDYVKENIFDPLGMKNSVYHVTPEIKEKMATQYVFEANEEITDVVDAQFGGSPKKGEYKIHDGNMYILGEEYDSGGAGIISTVDDYVLLASALANYGMGTTGERILAPATVDLMRTNTLNESQLKDFAWRQLVGYGYGLGVRTMIDKAKGGSLGSIGEFGWGGAAGASVYIDPKLNLAAVYAKHSLAPREEYYQPRVRNVLYSCID